MKYPDWVLGKSNPLDFNFLLENLSEDELDSEDIIPITSYNKNRRLEVAIPNRASSSINKPKVFSNPKPKPRAEPVYKNFFKVSIANIAKKTRQSEITDYIDEPIVATEVSYSFL